MKKDIPFYKRHIGPRENDINSMLNDLQESSLDKMIDKAVPQAIRLQNNLSLPEPLSEQEALLELKILMEKNHCHKSFIGQGYYGTFVPPVISRNLLENPSWYTAYTPYQAEISQGRLEMLFHFQTLVTELTGLPIAAASLLDEGTALAEAMSLAVRYFKNKRTKIVVAGEIYPQNLEVLKTRATSQNFSLSFDVDANFEDTAAVILSWPDFYGNFQNFEKIIEKAKRANSLIITITDPLALTILESPGHWGSDIVIGSLQRFGTPMGFGGPHAGYLAVSEALTRLIPGRIVGKSIDTKGRVGYRLALQTREQHIRRDKATSNICTAQALLANMSAAYAIWHGPSGLQNIAYFIHEKARIFSKILQKSGIEILNTCFFDCLTIKLPQMAEKIVERAYKQGFLLRLIDLDHLSVAFDELSTIQDLIKLAQIFEIPFDQEQIENFKNEKNYHETLPNKLRKTPFLTQEIFNKISSETEMMRFLKYLGDKDLALDRAMIPLGSCTMKLNAAAELFPLSWEKVSQIHPFAPKEDISGYLEMIKQLEAWLCEITGFSAISFQPNSGAQGEYAGLLAIKRYHKKKGQETRNICLIPQSAHGTNPASAHIAGMEIIVVKCLSDGDIDIEDLQEKAARYKDTLAAFMITYPSTHGVYEEGIKEICNIIHENGGQVYFDGANLNALVGLSRPFDLGADVCHMNLHKTFAIPHGGGGPGVGPIGVAEHLVPFLPGSSYEMNKNSSKTYAVSSSAFGSASILTISWMYIRMMGAQGLKRASQIAILNANYIAHTLSKSYPILYSGKNGYVAHECIIDTRVLKNQYNITIDDIAKRLIDYGFHAPTVSFPVSGTLMIEPTESESKLEIDRLCRALLQIAQEAKQIKEGVWSEDNNPLVNAPHTLEEIIDENWDRPYSRKIAAFPDEKQDFIRKYWPPVSRIDNVSGDRNLICSCPPLSNWI